MSSAAHARRLEHALHAYPGLLQRHWSAAGEAVLAEAYDLGRHLLDAGVTLLELSELHHRALADAAASGFALTPARLQSAGRLWNELLAGYEMLLRGYHDANAALRTMNDRLEEQIEQLARVLHDESGQLLAAVMIHLDQAIRSAPPDGAVALHEVRHLLDQVEFGLRRLAHELHPSLLTDLGLRPALEFLADGFAARAGLRISLEGDLPGRLPRAVELCLYRCVQECLNNVVRHAHASQVRIQIRQAGSVLHLRVGDDGQGFAPSAPSASQPAGMGVPGMRERLRGLGGELDLDSRPGAGAEVHLRVPIPIPGGHHGDSTAPGR